MPHDIFLSYATSEDTQLASAWAGQETWVMCFKVALEEAVNRELGRESSATWFLDAKDLRTGDELNSKIRDALDETVLFVALLSNGYFHPDSWCNLEREYFIDSLGTDGARQGRVLGVLLDENVLEEWKDKCFPSVRAFPFYARDQATESCMRLGEGEIDGPFIQRAATLGKEIAERIRECRTDSTDAEPPTPHFKGTVYLAAVPGEMEDSRTEIANMLRSHGWIVVPELNECNPDPVECEKEALALAASDETVAFIQLLGVHPWNPGRYDVAQHSGASMVDKPTLRYRSDDIDLPMVKNDGHRAFLTANDVKARSLPKLKDEVIQELDRLVSQSGEGKHAASHQEEGPGAFVTLSVSPAESATLGQTLSGRLQKSQVYAAIQASESPSLERPFLNEDGLVTVFGNEPYDRVESVLIAWRGLHAKHRPRLDKAPPIAIYLAAPPPADKMAAINMKLPGLRLLEWDDDQGFAALVDDVLCFARQRAAEARD